MSGKHLIKALNMVGTVTKEAIVKSNTNGEQWMSALVIAEMAVQQDHPTVDGVQVSGAKAHQSHTTKHHTNILSVKFYQGAKRIISGHVHLNGMVDYSKGGSRSRSANPNKAKPKKA
ncbi:hypothetical protein C8A00DRAFT_37470 [Chaetomidium leptoderma]|uniref:Uncharacterized protein n=1 Tax=Chaetomidium leptoderma TaxID=669021 RepID=A0AAN6VEN1_9PEZI|nr:hypothetical protein C8A00DRAFT_37470 [Chaetomidium leptoderma]